MARRMTLEGIEVKSVYEVMPTPGGLTRNIVQCLDDFGIPLHLSHTVTRAHGKHHLEGVTVMKLDENRQPVPGTEEFIECDLLVLAVGLIPENELSVQAGIELDPQTHGPVLDEDAMTSIPGIFAAGNVSVVYDLVDYVSLSGEIAARGALRYIRGEMPAEPRYQPVEYSGNIRFVVPQRVKKSDEEREVTFFMRVRHPAHGARLECTVDGKTAFQKKYQVVAPPEMLSCQAVVGPGQAPQLEIQEV